MKTSRRGQTEIVSNRKESEKAKKTGKRRRATLNGGAQSSRPREEEESKRHGENRKIIKGRTIFTKGNNA